MEIEYEMNNLPKLDDPDSYQNEFEKEAFMTLALIRADPKSMAKFVKGFKKHNMYTGQVINPLV